MLETNEKSLLAERLAGILAGAEKSDEAETQRLLPTVLAKLDDVTNRLASVESELRERRERKFAASSITLSHPSQQIFEIPAASEQFLPNTKIKACTFEPNGKPCDDCAMCSARGF